MPSCQKNLGFSDCVKISLCWWVFQHPKHKSVLEDCQCLRKVVRGYGEMSIFQKSLDSPLPYVHQAVKISLSMFFLDLCGVSARHLVGLILSPLSLKSSPCSSSNCWVVGKKNGSAKWIELAESRNRFTNLADGFYWVLTIHMAELP